MLEAVREQAIWRAELRLEYERRGQRTVLARRRHDGPLAVQKPLYPEGDGVCHTIVVHPPGGIVGGDEIDVAMRVGVGGHVLATTPGAGKWYRSAGPWAHQRIVLDIEPGAVLEWLPQETIVFDGAFADLQTDVRLSLDAGFFGWEILCLGRTGSGEGFRKGELLLRTAIQRDGRPLRLERARLQGGGETLDSAALLAGQPVAGALVAASLRLDGAVLAACRELKPMRGEGGVTLLPGLLVGRYLGSSSEAAKNYFMQLWRIARPALTGRAAVEPRIWRT
jgi:urease accessory protein